MAKILCDFDRPIPRDFSKRLAMVVSVHRLRVRYVRVDKTEHGFHVVVSVVGRLPLLRCVALQAILGSDWKRELFNSRRAFAWRNVPPFWRERSNVLYGRHFRGVVP